MGDGEMKFNSDPSKQLGVSVNGEIKAWVKLVEKQLQQLKFIPFNNPLIRQRIINMKIGLN